MFGLTVNGQLCLPSTYVRVKQACAQTEKYKPCWDVTSSEFVHMLSRNIKVPFISTSGNHKGKRFFYFPKTKKIIFDDTTSEIEKEWRIKALNEVQVATINAAAAGYESISIDKTGVIKANDTVLGKLNLIESAFQIIFDELSDDEDLAVSFNKDLLVISWE